MPCLCWPQPRRPLVALGLVLAVASGPGSPVISAHPSARNLARQSQASQALLFLPRDPGSLLQAVAADPSGTLWGIGQGDLQLRLPSQQGWTRLSRKPEDPQGNFQSLHAWMGGVVLGSPYSGLARYSGGRWTRLPEVGDSLGQIRGISVHQDFLWAATPTGLVRFHPVTAVPEAVPPPEGLSDARWVTLASGGERLLVVSERLGVFSWREGTWTTTHPEGKETLRGNLCAASDGKQLWIGGAGILREVDLGTGEARNLLASDPDLGRLVVTCLLARGPDLWMGTTGQGLFRRRQGAWQQFVPPFQNLPSAVVHGLTGLGSGSLLVSTSQGLVEVSEVDPGQSGNVRAWYPKSDVPAETDLSRTQPEPRQVFAVEAAGGQLSPLAALGDILFEDPELLGERARRMGISCGTCHPRGHMNTNFFVAGISKVRGSVDLTHRFFSSRSHNGKDDPVMIPSLRGIRHTAPYGRTQQAADLRSFTRNVIVLEFEGPEPDARTLDALVAYQREFDFLPTRWVGDDGQLSTEAPETVRRGETLFRRSFSSLPGGSCASCHPTHGFFSDGRMHDIGTGGSFDVPSLRNANYSAPYMHDGRFPSYSAVIEHFDQRYRLGLTSQERSDLEAYLLAVGEGLDPYR